MKKNQPKNSILVLGKGFIIILNLLGVYVIYGILRSYGWPVINTYDITSGIIHESKKICIVGDLHSKYFSTLTSQIQDENPDLILMAGDIFDDSDTELTKTFEVIQRLAQDYPVYFAIGNHEMNLSEKHVDFMDSLESSGVYIIDKVYFDIGDDIRVGGLYEYPFGWNNGGYNTADSAPERIKEYMNDFTNTDRFTIFVAHRPDSFYYGDASEVYSIDLVISAHIHGGQVVVPFKGGLYGGDQKWWPKYVHGYYEKNNIRWLITSGLSTSKKALPRFNNPPEIMIVNLIPE